MTGHSLVRCCLVPAFVGLALAATATRASDPAYPAARVESIHNIVSWREAIKKSKDQPSLKMRITKYPQLWRTPISNETACYGGTVAIDHTGSMKVYLPLDYRHIDTPQPPPYETPQMVSYTLFSEGTCTYDAILGVESCYSKEFSTEEHLVFNKFLGGNPHKIAKFFKRKALDAFIDHPDGDRYAEYVDCSRPLQDILRNLSKDDRHLAGFSQPTVPEVWLIQNQIGRRSLRFSIDWWLASLNDIPSALWRGIDNLLKL